ncbi:unnamed protein product [Rotaria sp. Silwood2]|nr:unnamed protein product [Rotaria sp. Silwood2]CAF3274775.1 unnamed protein product [Rotaria sp. Silwood2]CAF4104662.1 unnamed protein product [Rotaria sp. Silwood2]CAF4146777.1 unnamed protein product [Rotaria sp. Silwood2]CAF4620066.1 unnamed protein product [Rotaria sp. Silwood2]
MRGAMVNFDWLKFSANGFLPSWTIPLVIADCRDWIKNMSSSISANQKQQAGQGANAQKQQQIDQAGCAKQHQQASQAASGQQNQPHQFIH